MSVSALEAVVNVLNQRPANGVQTSSNNGDFESYLTQAIQTADNQGDDNRAFTDAILSGELNNLHDATIAAREAELSLSLVVQVRDRMVEAYNEIMRMQV
ncbi:flagellar hook-basal body complex protein FliE [Christensenellaceae bacterium OttesenSCG-928-M15]|nr:flagellar hook-basal body complex protein FliE [Christensenellaceae bacterium OttesenSCG-928-M15]